MVKYSIITIPSLKSYSGGETMKQIKNLTAVLVAVLLLVSIIPLGTFTASAATSGTTGECTWTLDGTTLTIGGNGKMANYTYSSAAPWGTTITKVVIKNGVISIGGWAFYNCINLTNITIPDSVTSIGGAAFNN